MVSEVTVPEVPAVDVVVVSYNSRAQLRACVEPLLGAPDAHVIVVDNASPDGSLDVVRGLPVTAIQLREQRRVRGAASTQVGAPDRPRTCSS